MHLLTLSGYIQEEKAREFHQTFQIVLMNKPKKCLDFRLSVDFMDSSLYFFFSLWPDEESMEVFYRSDEYETLTGAFRALGFIRKKRMGEFILRSDAGSLKPGS